VLQEFETDEAITILLEATEHRQNDEGCQDERENVRCMKLPAHGTGLPNKEKGEVC
jgi:hypothetical protein